MTWFSDHSQSLRATLDFILGFTKFQKIYLIEIYFSITSTRKKEYKDTCLVSTRYICSAFMTTRFHGKGWKTLFYCWPWFNSKLLWQKVSKNSNQSQFYKDSLPELTFSLSLPFGLTLTCNFVEGWKIPAHSHHVSCWYTLV